VNSERPACDLNSSFWRSTSILGIADGRLSVSTIMGLARWVKPKLQKTSRIFKDEMSRLGFVCDVTDDAVMMVR